MIGNNKSPLEKENKRMTKGIPRAKFYSPFRNGPVCNEINSEEKEKCHRH